MSKEAGRRPQTLFTPITEEVVCIGSTDIHRRYPIIHTDRGIIEIRIRAITSIGHENRFAVELALDKVAIGALHGSQFPIAVVGIPEFGPFAKGGGTEAFSQEYGGGIVFRSQNAQAVLVVFLQHGICTAIIPIGRIAPAVCGSGISVRVLGFRFCPGVVIARLISRRSSQVFLTPQGSGRKTQVYEPFHLRMAAAASLNGNRGRSALALYRGGKRGRTGGLGRYLAVVAGGIHVCQGRIVDLPLHTVDVGGIGRLYGGLERLFIANGHGGAGGLHGNIGHRDIRLFYGYFHRAALAVQAGRDGGLARGYGGNGGFLAAAGYGGDLFVAAAPGYFGNVGGVIRLYGGLYNHRSANSQGVAIGDVQFYGRGQDLSAGTRFGRFAFLGNRYFAGGLLAAVIRGYGNGGLAFGDTFYLAFVQRNHVHVRVVGRPGDFLVVGVGRFHLCRKCLGFTHLKGEGSGREFDACYGNLLLLGGTSCQQEYRHTRKGNEGFKDAHRL